jgi:hypothetical protein
MRIGSNVFRRQTWRRDAREGHGNRLTALAGGAFLLAGCSLGPAITENSADYGTTIEEVTNGAMVANILRARDHAPLYFTDLSQIRGSLQLNVQPVQTTIPYAHFLGSTTPSTVQAGPLTVASQPGFDFAPLNTKNFAEGMLTGIDQRVFSYLVQRPIPLELFLPLVVARIEKYHQIGVDKGGDPRYGLVGTPCVDDDCQKLLDIWIHVPWPTIGVWTKDNDIGPAIPANILATQREALRDLVKVDGAGLDLNLDKRKHAYQLSKTEYKYVLCVTTRPGRRVAVGISSFGATKDPNKPLVAEDDKGCGSQHVDPDRYVLYTRSVEAIFFHLGNMLRHHSAKTSPLYFWIYNQPVEGARFHMSYRGTTYFVREASDNRQDPDNTMIILALLNALMNLNRDANEIPSTRTVATTP